MPAATSFFLSKSQFTRGLQCHKSLWLLKNRNELRAAPDAGLQARFESGTAVGLLAQHLFPGGTALDFSNGMSHNIGKTRELIASGVQTIYEATFRHDNVLAMIDILHWGPGGWELYEVKSSTETRDIYLNDTAIQYYVAAGAGMTISRVLLVHLNNRYTRMGDLDLQGLFTVDDVTDLTLARQADIPGQLADMRRSLAGSEPDIDIGPYCFEPYECDFRTYCWHHIPPCSIFDLANLRNNRKFALYYSGALHLRDIPPDFPLSDQMRIQIEAEATGRDFINKPAIRKFVATVVEPAGFLDFETFMEPVPSLDNQRPYQQVPFQYSLHILAGKKLSHYEFLAEAGKDPRRPFIERLLTDCRPCRTILVYNQLFEEVRLQELAALCPDLRLDIADLIARIVDLMTPFRNRDFYVRAMCGSYSIKAVLPALVPGLNYSGLAIADGEMAMLAYARLAKTEDMAAREKIRQDLLAYCGLDTLGMVRIWERMAAEVQSGGQLSLF